MWEIKKITFNPGTPGEQTYEVGKPVEYGKSNIEVIAEEYSGDERFYIAIYVEGKTYARYYNVAYVTFYQ